MRFMGVDSHFRGLFTRVTLPLAVFGLINQAARTVMAIIGLIPTVAVFVVFFMRWEARERWTLVVPYTAALVSFIWFTFDYVMAVPWPPTLLGQWYPAFKAIPSV